MISKCKGRYNLCSRGEEWEISIRLPKDAPEPRLSETWPLDEEPDIYDLPPSKVAELISIRVESFWFASGKERDRKTLRWIRANAERLDAEWARLEIARMMRQIRRLQARIVSLQELAAAE